MKVIVAVGLLLAALVAPYAEATYGVDVSTAVSTSDWECMVQNGYTFAIVRVYQSNGQVDANGAQTIKNARAGGVSYVDGYIFPCYSCGDAAGQVSAAISHLNSNGAVIGQIWLDIEGTQYWSSSCSSNVNFIQEMVDEANRLGVVVAIYTSNSQWSPIACSSTQFSNLQLWYAHYDDNPSFSDFAAFGGWTKPAMKQYQGTTTLCGAGVDKDFY